MSKSKKAISILTTLIVAIIIASLITWLTASDDERADLMTIIGNHSDPSQER